MSQQVRRNPYRRVTKTTETYTVESDVTLLRTLAQLRFATTTIACTALSASRNPGGINRRLRNLYDAGLVDRVYLPAVYAFSTGGRESVWYIGTGAVDLLTERRHELQIRTPLERRQYIDDEILPACRDLRDWKARVLEGVLAQPKKEVARLLQQNEALAIKVATGQQSEIAHFLLTSEILSMILLATERRGISVTDVRTDSSVSHQVHDSQDTFKYRTWAVLKKTKSTITYHYPIEPDVLLVVEKNGERTALWLEAETGSNPRTKIEKKVAYYLAANATGHLDTILADEGIAPVKSHRVVLITRNFAHCNMAVSTLPDVERSGSGLFLFAHLGAGGLEWTPDSVPAESVKENWLTSDIVAWRNRVATVTDENDPDDEEAPKTKRRWRPATTSKTIEGIRVLDAISDQFSEPLFAQYDTNIPKEDDPSDHIKLVPLFP